MPGATLRLLRATSGVELSKAIVRSVVGGALVAGVFFGPNGVDPHDVVRHLRGSIVVSLVLCELAALWVAPDVRRALVAPGTDVLRALPYRPGVIGGALFVGVLAAFVPLVVLVVAGGGSGLAVGCSLATLVAVLQPRAMRLAFGRPPSLAVPWAVLVASARSDPASYLRGMAALGLVVMAARAGARTAAPEAAAVVAALAVVALAGSPIARSIAAGVRSMQSLPLGPRSWLGWQAIALVAVVPFWAIVIGLGSVSAAVAGATTLAIAVGGLVEGLAGPRGEERLGVHVAVTIVAGAGALFFATWAVPVVLAAMSVAVRARSHR